MDGVHCDPLHVPLPGSCCGCFSKDAVGVAVVPTKPQTPVAKGKLLEMPNSTADSKKGKRDSVDAVAGRLATELAQAVGLAAKAAAYGVIKQAFATTVEQDEKNHTDSQGPTHSWPLSGHFVGDTPLSGLANERKAARPVLHHSATHASFATSVASYASQCQGQDVFSSMQGLEEAICSGLMDSFFERVRVEREQIVHNAKVARESADTVLGDSRNPAPDAHDVCQNEAQDVVKVIVQPCDLADSLSENHGESESDASSCISVTLENKSEDDGEDDLASVGDQPLQDASFGQSCESLDGAASSRLPGRLVTSISQRFRNSRKVSFLAKWHQSSSTSTRIKQSCSKIWPPTDSCTTLEGLRIENDSRLSHMAVKRTEKPRFRWSLTVASLSSERAGSSANLHGVWVTCWLQLWGVMPAQCCGISWNRGLCILTAMFVLAYNLWQMLSFSLESDWQIAMGDLILSLCTLGCLVSSNSLHQCGLLSRHKAVLLQYADHRGFLPQWKGRSQKTLILTVLAWGSMVLSRIILQSLGSADGHPEADSKQPAPLVATRKVITALTFTFTTGVITATALYLLHYLIGFLLAIGAFCLQCTEHEADFDVLKTDWNILQALLRQASLKTSPSFVWLVMSAGIMFISSAAFLLFERPKPSHYLPAVVPIILLILWLYRMMWIAGGVTSTCLRMPAFINSLGKPGDKGEKQSLVEYVKNSAAGFYVQETILTAEVILKLLYLSIVVMFTIVTKVSTEEVIS